jgi:hypothetical protein
LVGHDISIVVWIIRANTDIPSFIHKTTRHLPISAFIIHIKITYLPSCSTILQKTSACFLLYVLVQRRIHRMQDILATEACNKACNKTIKSWYYGMRQSSPLFVFH